MRVMAEVSLQSQGQWSWTFLSAILLITLFIIFRSNALLRYYGHYVIYIGTVSFAAMFAIPLFCLNPRNVINLVYISSLLKHVTKLLGITWELRNGEILAEERGCVIVANHQSMLDILGMFNIWGVMGKCAAVARKEVFYVWPFGVGAWLGGVVFIDRVHPTQAKEQLNKASQLMNTDKVKLWMFPEGTRNKKGMSLLPFKKGAFRVAITCQVPVLPVVYSPYYFLDSEKLVFGSGKIIIKALPPISTEGLTMSDVDDLMERTRNIMLETYNEISKEVLVNKKIE